MEWNIQQLSKHCNNCNSEFKDRELYHSFLVLKGNELERKDYCEICFGSVDAEIKKDESAYWKSRYKLIIVPPKEDPIKRDKVEHLLRTYIAKEMTDENKKLCYLLVIMLERKRILKQQSTIKDDTDGRDVFVYEHTKTGESFSIPYPNLSMTEIPELQEKIQVLLDS
ncbi:MAG: hypothetical protein P9M13_06295 [Candidatus Ancaeobacter aquaticus]|nr:hypothetical protein [Candidatus Ancaeobacter aquaticus]